MLSCHAASPGDRPSARNSRRAGRWCLSSRFCRARIRRIAQLAAILVFAAVSDALHAQGDVPPLHFQVEWGVRIPTRDGVLLNATIYRPARQSERLPVIMTMTPYVSDRFHSVAAYFAQHGYVFALVDTRGRGNSGGIFEPWIHDGRDGYDAVEWLAHRPYADGQIGMWGGSYAGKNQWAVASLAPPSLRTIVPASAGYVGYDVPMRRNIPMPWSLQYLTLLAGRTSNRNLFSDQAFWNAAFAELSRGSVSFRQFERIPGIEAPFFQIWASHPERNEFWDAANPDSRSLGAIDIPILTITGYFDDAQTGALEFQRLHFAGASDRARLRHYTLVGPWDHAGTREPTRVLGGIDFGAAAMLDVLRLHVAWYDWVMKGGPRPEELRDRFVYYLPGADRWEALPAMPTRAQGQTLFLSSPGRTADSLADHGDLVVIAPRQARDAYRYDPGVPARNEGVEAGEAVTPNYLTDPRSFAVLHGDGLIYDSLPFPAATRLAGRPAATLQLAMDVPDTDIRVQLFLVHRDGSVVFLGHDQIRARYRNSPRRAEPVQPGRIEEYLFDQFPFVAWQLEPGVRLRLVISPLGMSIHQQRNRNSGGIVADETAADNRVARVSVALGPGRSRLVLPISVVRR